MRDRKDETGPVPAPDAPADDLEQKRAARFGELVSTLVEGDRLPPAMDPDDRMLVDVASMIRASTSDVSLSSDKARSIASDAIRRATGSERPPSISSLPAIKSGRPDKSDELGKRRRGMTIAPWALTALAAAAAIFLWISRPPRQAPPAPTATLESPSLAPSQRSRPADRLVGVIARSDTHLASSRIDVIYADRLDGYRSLALAPRTRGARRD